VAEKTYTAQEIADGVNIAHNEIRNQTGYTGDFGKIDGVGQFYAWLANNEGKRAATESVLADYNAAYNAGQSYTGPTASPQALPPADALGLTSGQSSLMSGQSNLLGGQTDILGGQSDLLGGQTDILGGQVGLAEGQGDILGGQATLGVGQQGLMSGQNTLSTNQQQLGSAIGQDATSSAPATGLYAGQSGLMSGQADLSGQVDAGIGDVTANLTAFQQLVKNYQAQAAGERGNIQQSGVTGRAQLGKQVGGVEIAANKAAEQATAMRQAAPTLTASAPQSAQGYSFMAPPARGVATQTGQAAPVSNTSTPLGPATADPRDALIQSLMQYFQNTQTN
tara:strand:- start:55 stop:1065 length:1011 start_codon:yes stop_codon:yes gene_type:complete